MDSLFRRSYRNHFPGCVERVWSVFGWRPRNGIEWMLLFSLLYFVNLIREVFHPQMLKLVIRGRLGLRCPALASDQATHTVQAVRTYAPGARQSQSCLPGWHDDSHRRSTWSWETPVPPTVSNTKLQNWSSSLVSEVSRTLDRRHGTHFLPISKN